MKFTERVKLVFSKDKSLYIQDGSSYYLPSIRKIIHEGDFFTNEPFEDYICIHDIHEGFVRYTIYYPDGTEGQKMDVERFCQRYEEGKIVKRKGLFK